jgi:acyl-CoA synthetase (AMP-forming)/AMP-acid ligase II
VLDVKELGKLKGNGSKSLEIAQPDDVALVLHTSGTTGRPKAVPLTHKNLTRTMKNIQATYDLGPSDRTYLVMPLFHVHGLLAGFLAPLASAGSVIVPQKFSATQFWSDFIAHEANWYTAVPTMHQILLRSPFPSSIPKIRFIRSCSSPLSPKVFHELEKALNAPVLEAYAMTEAAHQMCSNPLPSRGQRIPGSVGISQGVEVKILDQNGDELPRETNGEICIRGENVTKGYLNNEAANASSFTKGNFFRTGDQGKMDKNGYVYITGRIKELINKGGEKISPIELDNTLAQHPAVSEAVSFATDDEMYGQEIGVAIVLRDGKKLTEQELIAWMREKVAKFKVPKRVWFTDVMPKTATGKIQRRNVAEAMLKKDETKAKL